MTETLFPYQVIGADWLAKRKLALLADEMGLGKSAQVVSACDKINAKRILIICPAVARLNWLREFEKFSTTSRSFSILETQKPSTELSECVVTSYDLAAKNSKALCEKLKSWDVLVLDESHYLKSPTTARTVAIFGKGGLVRSADRVWALSGTPAPNHAGELWPILFTFGVTKLSYDDFIKNYCHSYQVSYSRRQISGTKIEKIPEIRMMLSQVMLRRKKEDVMKELPPIQYVDTVVEPGPVDLEMESSFLKYVFPDDKRDELNQKLSFERQLIENVVNSTGFGRDGMKALEGLANSVSTLRRYTGIQKVKAVSTMVAEELNLGLYEKIVLFAVHRDVIEGLRVHLVKFKPVTLYGKTDPARRDRNVDKFQNNPKCQVFIGNIQSAGTAITLTAAHNIIFVEQDWVPGNNAQAAMRCHRIGQTKPVLVRFAGLVDSIDQRVSEVLRRKTRDLSAIFDGDVLQKEIADATNLSTS